MPLKITTLIENSKPEGSALLSEHGLSFFIEKDGIRLVFDTGQTGSFLTNADRIGVDPGNPDFVVISHGHYDHAGGFSYLAGLGCDFELVTGRGFFRPKYSYAKRSYRYLGAAFDEARLAELGIRYREASGGMTAIADGLFILSDFPRVHPEEKVNPRFVFREADGNVPDAFDDEIMLAVDTPKGFVLVIGCCHPGLRNMLDAAKARLDGGIYAVLGGTHLVEASPSGIDLAVEYLKKSGIKLLGLSHCTGEDAVKRLSAEVPGYFHNMTGSVLNV